MKKVLVLLIITCLGMMGCSRKILPTDGKTSFTVGLANKAEKKKLEKEIQYWSSEKVRFYLVDNKEEFDVDEDGTIIEGSGEQKKVFIVDKDLQGKLVYIKNKIYWIKFDKNDKRLVPFQRECNGDDCRYFLSVQKSNLSEVLLSDGKKYSVKGNPFLRVLLNFENLDGKESKNASGVTVNE